MDKEWVEKRNKENEQKYEELKNNLYKEIKTSIYLNESKRQAALQHCEDEDFFRVEDKEFFASIIYYDDSMFLYIQSNNGEDIDKEIPNPTDYIKKGIDFECKEWQRYDLSKSYLYSMKKGNDDILEYLSSVLP